MNTIKLNSLDLVELDTDQLTQTSGGFWALFVPVLINYVIIDIALNPQKSYDAFMAGWNSV